MFSCPSGVSRDGLHQRISAFHGGLVRSNAAAACDGGLRRLAEPGSFWIGERSHERLWIRGEVRILSETVEHEIHKAANAHGQVFAVWIVNEEVSGLRNPIRQHGHESLGSKQRKRQRERHKRQAVSVHSGHGERGDVVCNKIARDRRRNGSSVRTQVPIERPDGSRPSPQSQAVMPCEICRPARYSILCEVRR
jgi:hypothetical protein